GTACLVPSKRAAVRVLPGAVAGPSKSEAASRAVTLHHDATQPEQACTVVAAWIDPRAETVDHRQGDHPAQLGDPIARELFAQRIAQHASELFGPPQEHVAD